MIENTNTEEISESEKHTKKALFLTLQQECIWNSSCLVGFISDILIMLFYISEEYYRNVIDVHSYPAGF